MDVSGATCDINAGFVDPHPAMEFRNAAVQSNGIQHNINSNTWINILLFCGSFDFPLC